MTAQEIKQLKEDYTHISAVYEIIQKTIDNFENKEWNAHQGEFHTRSQLKKMKKAYGEKLIGTIL
jgi:hypothetical protein